MIGEEKFSGSVADGVFGDNKWIIFLYFSIKMHIVGTH